MFNLELYIKIHPYYYPVLFLYFVQLYPEG